MSTRVALPDGPWRLTLVTNPDDCNLACGMCPCGAARAAPSAGRPGAPRRMDPVLALSVLDERRGSPLREVIPSTLGEPLLWAGLDVVLDRCAAVGLRVNVTTNGTWPGRGAEAWARRLAPLASDVKISWNGANSATAAAIMAGLDLAAAVEGVRTFVRVRDEVAAAGGPRADLSFQVTVQARNVDEVPAIVRLAASLGVDRVKLNHLQPRVPGHEALAGAPLAGDGEGVRRWNAAVAQARDEAATGARTGRPVVLENAVELGPAPPAPGPCPFLGREAWIHPDGRLAPCPHPAAALPASEGGLGDFGSVAERPLGELWAAGRALAAFAAAWPAHPACRACPLRTPGGAGAARVRP